MAAKGKRNHAVWLNAMRLLQIYRANFKTTLAVQLQYRVSAVIWLIGLVITPVVYLVVWGTVANASGGAVGGYNAAEFAAYYIAMMVVNHLTFVWHMWEYDFRIREGLLSPMLLRPLHPIHVDIAENLSYKAVTSLVLIPITIVLAFIFRPAWNLTWGSAAAFLPALVLAFFVQFFFGWTLAMAAFWTTRINAINRTYFLGKLFLAGQMAPIALLPPALQTVSSFTPFRWMLSFPVEVLLGRLTTSQIVWGLGAQAIWVVLGLTAVKIVWRAGIRRYAAFGA